MPINEKKTKENNPQIGNASIGYYGKYPPEMSEYQTALLAGAPNASSVYSSLKNLRLVQKRQRHVIDQIVKYGYTTETEAQIRINSN